MGLLQVTYLTLNKGIEKEKGRWTKKYYIGDQALKSTQLVKLLKDEACSE